MLSKVLKQVSPIVKLSSRGYHNVLTEQSLSDNVKKAEYAVRGKIPIRGEEIQSQINKGKKFSFPSTTSLNIGNP
jgi:alanine transaminase